MVFTCYVLRQKKSFIEGRRLLSVISKSPLSPFLIGLNPINAYQPWTQGPSQCSTLMCTVTSLNLTRLFSFLHIPSLIYQCRNNCNAFDILRPCSPVFYFLETFPVSIFINWFPSLYLEDKSVTMTLLLFPQFHLSVLGFFVCFINWSN